MGNPRPSPRPHQPISIFNSPFKRFTQFRSPLSPSINTSFFPPMSLNCPPPPLFSPLQPPPPPPPPAPAAPKTTLATRLRQTPNPRPSPRPHQPISIFNSPFKRFTQFRG